MPEFAIIQNEIVENVILWDGTSEYTPPTGATSVQVPPGTIVGIGCSYSNGVFSAPASSTPPAPTLAQQAAAAAVSTVALTSTSTSALDGTYSIDNESRLDMQSEVLAFETNGQFLGGQTTIQWPQTDGTIATFTATQFKAFVTKVGAYVGTLKSIRRTGKLPSGTSSFPSNSIAIS